MSYWQPPEDEPTWSPEDIKQWAEGETPIEERPKTQARSEYRAGRSAASVGEEFNSETGKWEPKRDAEGYEWIIPSQTRNPQKPFSRYIGYNPKEHKLRVMFRAGSPVSNWEGTWVYEGVTGHEFAELRRSRSTGRYIIRHLKDTHRNHYEHFDYPF